MGGLGLSDLIFRDAYCVIEITKNFSGKEPIRPNIDPDKPYLSRNSQQHNIFFENIAMTCKELKEVLQFIVAEYKMHKE